MMIRIVLFSLNVVVCAANVALYVTAGNPLSMFAAIITAAAALLGLVMMLRD